MVLDTYYEEHIAVAAADKERARYGIAMLKRGLGPLLVSDLSIPVARKYLARRERGDLTNAHGAHSGAGTVRRELSILTAAIAHAVRWRRMDKGSVPYIELPAKGEARERWLTRHELARLLWVNRRNRRLTRFIRLAYYTASRKGAILEMRASQVDLKHNVIDLHPAGKQRTKKRRPKLPIHPKLRCLLRTMLRPLEPEDLLLDGQTLRHSFENAVEQAGLGDDVTPHTLRHTRATHLLQRGTDIWAVAGLLGDTVATIEATYGHHSPDHLAGTIR